MSTEYEQICDLSDRSDCSPNIAVDGDSCRAHGCCWNPSEIDNEPWCFYPKDTGYKTNESNYDQSATAKGNYNLLGLNVEGNIEQNYILVLQSICKLRGKV